MGNSAAPACLDTVQEIAGLLREQLCIPANPPRVFIYNSDWTIPKTTDMFLVVGVLTGDPFGQGQGYKSDPVTGGLLETNIVENLLTLTIDAFSVTRESFRRQSEIAMALTGDAAERLMERLSIRIFRPSAFRDLSALEASRRLNRYQRTVDVIEGFGAQRQVPYFTTPARKALLVQP